MALSIAVIGAGWCGCQIALSLSRLCLDVTVFDWNNTALHEASNNNQFRFHYPRHHSTCAEPGLNAFDALVCAKRGRRPLCAENVV